MIRFVCSNFLAGIILMTHDASHEVYLRKRRGIRIIHYTLNVQYTSTSIWSEHNQMTVRQFIEWSSASEEFFTSLYVHCCPLLYSEATAGPLWQYIRPSKILNHKQQQAEEVIQEVKSKSKKNIKLDESFAPSAKPKVSNIIYFSLTSLYFEMNGAHRKNTTNYFTEIS